jgi:hypothetical protein
VLNIPQIVAKFSFLIRNDGKVYLPNRASSTCFSCITLQKAANLPSESGKVYLLLAIALL